MYSHIIVPVDFAHEAMVDQAIEVGQKLLNPGGQITLLHVIEDLPGYVASSIPEEILHRTRGQASDQLHKMADDYGSFCAAVMRHGSPSREILKLAKEKNAGCIIVASHQPGIQDYFLGSTAAWVVRHAQCCVHVLR